jgi:hypothetical protein
MSSYVVTGASRGIGVCLSPLYLIRQIPSVEKRWPRLRLVKYEFILELSKNPANTVIGIVRDVKFTEDKLAKEPESRSNIHLIQGDMTDYQSLKVGCMDLASTLSIHTDTESRMQLRRPLRSREEVSTTSSPTQAPCTQSRQSTGSGRCGFKPLPYLLVGIVHFSAHLLKSWKNLQSSWSKATRVCHFVCFQHQRHRQRAPDQSFHAACPQWSRQEGNHHF